MRPGILRTSLVAILVSCVLVCPECWLGALAASFLGIEHSDASSCVCACCVHAGPARVVNDEEADHEHGSCPSDCGGHTPAIAGHNAPQDGREGQAPGACICDGAIAPVVIAASILPTDSAVLSLPVAEVSLPFGAGHYAEDLSASVPSSGGRALRLALGSLLI